MSLKALPKELIIHPGETLRELLEDREMASYELAMRCGVTEEHINSLISGNCSISVTLAKQLETVFGVEMDFWLNLQKLYDRELAECSEARDCR